MEGTMPSGLGWCGHRGRAWLSPLGSHGTSPNFLRLHPHSPGSAPPRLDGSSFSASMAPRATCSARDGRQLVLLTPSPRVARPAEGRRVGRPRRRRATTGFRLRATSWGNRDSSLHPHFPPHQSPICLAPQPAPHLPGHRGGRRGAPERDGPSNQPWDLGHVTPAEPQCPRPQNGENEGSLPVCPACPEKALSPQSAWPLPWLAAHPAHSSARLCTWTLRVTTVLMGSGGHDP